MTETEREDASEAFTVPADAVGRPVGRDALLFRVDHPQVKWLVVPIHFGAIRSYVSTMALTTDAKVRRAHKDSALANAARVAVAWDEIVWRPALPVTWGSAS